MTGRGGWSRWTVIVARGKRRFSAVNVTGTSGDKYRPPMDLADGVDVGAWLGHFTEASGGEKTAARKRKEADRHEPDHHSTCAAGQARRKDREHPEHGEAYRGQGRKDGSG